MYRTLINGDGRNWEALKQFFILFLGKETSASINNIYSNFPEIKSGLARFHKVPYLGSWCLPGFTGTLESS